MKPLRLIFAFLAIPALALMMGCSGPEDELDLEADIAYEYIMDAEMLDYFDIYATRYDAGTGFVYFRPKLMHTEDGTKAVISYSETTRDTSVDHGITFTVTRKPGTTLTQDANWTTKINMEVLVTLPDDTQKFYESSQSNEYNLTPETFDTWAETYIYRMSLGYQLYILYNGKVNFSTE